jgi:ribonuclease R
VLRRRILAAVEEAGRAGITAEDLLRRLRQAAAETADQAEVEAALGRLQSDGLVAEEESGAWKAAGAVEGRIGVVEPLDEGDALILDRVGGEPILFVPRRSLGGAQKGDRVLVRPSGRPAGGARRSAGAAGAGGTARAVGAARAVRGARPPRLPEAEVAKILHHRHDTLVGTIETDEQGRRWLAPFDTRVSLELAVDGAEGVTAGEMVVVEVVPARARRVPRARLVEVLGPPDAPGVDVLAILRHYRIPDAFPAEVERAAEALPADPRPPDWEGREDLRGEIVVTIDGESARDFDDAVSIERLAGGVFRLGVHIADVSHYVAEGSVLDLEAYRRGTSVYYPERAVPMLPERLSNGLCSLRPHTSRLTLSAFLDIDRDGQVLHRRFARTVIRSSRRMTYEEVRRLLLAPRPEDAAAYGDVLPALREMHHLMQILLHARMVRGSIDFDLPEGNVELDTDGVMVGIQPQERTVAHRLVEEFMIAANEAVAFALASNEIPALFRVHDPPRLERLEELREILRPLGIELSGELDALHPAALQEVLRRVEGRPEEHFVSSVVLRTMQRAIYHPECRGHYALASRYYTHFTSPIRRYPDLLVHRQLKALLDAGMETPPDGKPRVRGKALGGLQIGDLAARLPAIGEHASATEKRAEQSERDLLQWKKVRFLAGRAGERFRGRITGVQPFGLFVQLEGLNVDGLVPIRTLGDDYYVYEPEAHRLVGERHGRVLQLADAVEVELTGADLRHRGLDLKLAGLPQPPPLPQGQPRGRPRPGGSPKRPARPGPRGRRERP